MGETKHATLYTWGYGNDRNHDRLLRHLKEYEISHLIDVRRGGGRRMLWAPLEIVGAAQSVGVRYDHEKDLGNCHKAIPWLPSMLAPSKLLMVADRARYSTVCLMCAEGKPFDDDGQPRCHRVEVADKVAALLAVLDVDCKVVHLLPGG